MNRYTKEERLVIGKLIYEGKLSQPDAAQQFGISSDTARNYMREYRKANNLPPKNYKPDANPQSLTIRLPNVLRTMLADRAERDKTTKSAIVKSALTNYLDK